MNITLTLQEEDYGFVVEAIKLRTTSMLDSFDAQVTRQHEAAILASIQPEPWEAEYKKDKIVAKRKANAPYGYKKDGTPKQRPGRPVGFN